MAKKRIDQLPIMQRNPTAGDKVHVWDGAMARSVQVDVSDLPGNGTGTGGANVVVVANPITLFRNAVAYQWDAVNRKSIIRHAGLLNKTNYPVYSTQLGLEFRKSSLTYIPIDPLDSDLGRLEIAGFELLVNEHLTITVAGALDSSGDTEYQKLKSDVAQLKLLAAPFLATPTGANGGKVWWLYADGPIPAGWQECIAMRGYFPMHQDPADVYDAQTNPEAFGRGVGETGGSKTHTNTVEEMAKHAHKQGSESMYDDYHDPDADENEPNDKNGSLVGNRYYPTTTAFSQAFRNQKTNKIGGGKPYSIMNPFILGVWIEFVGLA